MGGAYTWEDAWADLELWHAEHRVSAARSALQFIESELRLRAPPEARGPANVEILNDALQNFLEGLLKKPLPCLPENPRAYLRRALRNRCIDLLRKQQRRSEVPIQEDQGRESPANEPPADHGMERHEDAAQLRAALATLAIQDRVALKLVDAPELLDTQELRWLGERGRLSQDQVLERIHAATDVYHLTEIFDPPKDAAVDDRRHRMERFRRRRGRARDKLRPLMEARGVTR